MRPSRRREMPSTLSTPKGLAFGWRVTFINVSQTSYRYSAKRNTENKEVARWLMCLTDNHRNWGFGLCYLYLRNVRGYGWNNKRV